MEGGALRLLVETKPTTATKAGLLLVPADAHVGSDGWELAATLTFLKGEFWVCGPYTCPSDHMPQRDAASVYTVGPTAAECLALYLQVRGGLRGEIAVLKAHASSDALNTGASTAFELELSETPMGLREVQRESINHGGPLLNSLMQ
jgi:hypothetical protein